MKRIRMTALAMFLTIGFSRGAMAAETPTTQKAAHPAAPTTEAAPAAAGAEVTLVGLALSNGHFGDDKEKYCVFQAFDGTPEIKAEFDKIVAEYYPDKGLDGDAARKLQDQILARLKYSVDGPQLAELRKKVAFGANILALTGVVSEKDGKKIITVSKFKDVSYEGKNPQFAYPAKMLAPDKPFVMPDKDPLVLKIDDTLSLKCVYIPPGKFFMGEPYYEAPHWAEDSPHMVTLTKGYYLAECPVTQEMYEAVAGNNPCKTSIGPQAPIHNVSCVDMYNFCRLLSEKTGRKVRIPTAAEWDYAARVGTSNPPFLAKFKAQSSFVPGGSNLADPPPVKTKQPNAWGLYDMPSSYWERVSDATSNKNEHEDTVDPQRIPPADRGVGDPNRKHGHMGKGVGIYAIGEFEYIDSTPGRNATFRVAVDADN